ncbi:hypothetical protein M3J09_011901 [Ascochyta lentis]
MGLPLPLSLNEARWRRASYRLIKSSDAPAPSLPQTETDLPTPTRSGASYLQPNSKRGSSLPQVGFFETWGQQQTGS